MTPEQLSEVQRLRDRKVNPKQIARKLGLRPAEVKVAIQQQAEQQYQATLSADGQPPLEGCFANGSMVNALFHNKTKLAAKHGSLGLGTVMVVRQQRSKLIASIFLIDYYCLGVKNAASLQLNNQEKYRHAKTVSFESFPEGPEDISLEQAQALVFGAADYAQKLGLSPHADFQKSKEILGSPPDTLPQLAFGKNGKPFYVSGPYDQPQRIIQTLERSVGKGNYDYLLMATDDMSLF